MIKTELSPLRPPATSPAVTAIPTLRPRPSRDIMYMLHSGGLQTSLFVSQVQTLKEASYHPPSESANFHRTRPRSRNSENVATHQDVVMVVDFQSVSESQEEERRETECVCNTI